MAACALPLAALADEASSLYHPQSFRALVTVVEAAGADMGRRAQ